MNAKTITLSDERIASDTCAQLVRQGRNFTVSKVADGWRFEVFDEPHTTTDGFDLLKNDPDT